MTAPDPVDVATTLTNNVGTQVVDTAVNLAPVAVPFVLAMTAIGWVLKKFGLRSGAGLSSGGVETYSETHGGRCRSCKRQVDPGEGTLCHDCSSEIDEEQRSMR